MIGHSLIGVVIATHAEAGAFRRGLNFLPGGELETDAPCRVERLSDPLDDFGVLLAVCGPGRERAARAANLLLDKGADGLLCVGVGGGLNPEAACGDVIVAERVLDADAQGEGLVVECERRETLPRDLRDVGLSPRTGDLATSTRPLLTPGEKAEAFGRTRALAVDMESHAVGKVAWEAGMLFMALRTVGDTAQDAIPKELLAGLTPDGGLNPWALAGSVARKPGIIKAMVHLARQSRRALKNLATATPELVWHAKMLLDGE